MRNYHWTIPDHAKELLGEIKSLQMVFDLLPYHPQTFKNFLRRSLLTSAVYSARIEDIQADMFHPHKLEVQNLVLAYQNVFSQTQNTIFTLDYLKKLHSLVLRNISNTAGEWRNESWAIFNQAGVAIHLATPHYELKTIMPEYVNFINQLSENIVVKAAIAQFIFEKIHPFADGNGRVGRLISTSILHSQNLGFKGFVPLEEYINKHRDLYYQALEPSHDISLFIEFFVEALVNQAKVSLDQLKNPPQLDENRLTPRQQEILSIVRDHPYSSFDFLARRFSAIPVHTLHYELNKLQKMDLIIKIGLTRGATYKAREV